MKRGYDKATRARENRRYRGTCGVSASGRKVGLEPAFRHSISGEVARACFADGRPAPMHLLDGVPASWVARRFEGGKVAMLVPEVEAGFLLDGMFLSRAEAAELANS